MTDSGRWNVRVIAPPAGEAAAAEMRRLACPERSIERMAPKADALAVVLEGATPAQANLLKQEMLAAGGDAAIRPEAWLGSTGPTAPETTDVVLVGTRLELETLLLGLDQVPAADLPEMGREVADALAGSERRTFEVPLPRGSLTVGPRPALMGIVNVTPDSFSDGGEHFDADAAVEHGRRLADEGADILDVGGESTRPGSDPVRPEEELRRVLPVVERLAATVDVPVSIDTRRGRVARESLAAGARIVNDVSGLQGDPDVAAAAADAGAAVVIMHMLGEPKTMQVDPHYENLLGEVCRHLRNGIAVARRAGIGEERIVVDPGIGFGKTLEHNLSLLARLGELRSLGRPILVGPSRKRFIGELTAVETPAERTFGTAAACALAVAAGALVLRVHDVRQMREAVAVAAAVRDARGRTPAPVPGPETS